MAAAYRPAEKARIIATESDNRNQKEQFLGTFCQINRKSPYKPK